MRNSDARIPPELTQKWQEIVDLIAAIVQVPASLIMRVEPKEITVLVASDSQGNPYERGERAPLDTGLYCETVMKTRDRLLVPNAPEDEHWCCNPDLKLGMVSYLGFPIVWPSGEIFGTICVLDVKANPYSELHQRLLSQFRRVIEADLRYLCDFDAELAAETRARLEESERAQRKLEEAVRMRDDFLSIASHELRTPITSLKLMLQSLTRGLSSSSPENTQRALVLAERQLAKLTRLIDELLEVSRIQGGRVELHLEPLDLAAVVRGVIEHLKDDLARARCPLSLKADQPLMGRWDRRRIEQIVTNILSNAMKFGAGKPIEVTIEEAPPGTARIAISDHGIGVPLDRLPFIFERFERAVSPRSYGGLGLGLYIVQSLVEALGGAVRVESVPDQGSTFTVELSCGEPSPQR